MRQETLLFKETRAAAQIAKVATGKALGASQIVRTANVAEAPRAAPVVKEAARNVVGASQILRTANVAETPGAAKVATRIAEEAATGPTVNVEAVVERLLEIYLSLRKLLK